MMINLTRLKLRAIFIGKLLVALSAIQIAILQTSGIFNFQTVFISSIFATVIVLFW